MVRRSPTGACQCWRCLAMPRTPRSSRLATSTSSSAWSSPASWMSSCSWQLPGQPPSTHNRSPQMVDTANPWAVWACRLASQEHLLVGPAAGALHPGGQPVHHDRLAGTCHLRKPAAQVIQAGDEAAVGLAGPQRGRLGRRQVEAVADLGLGDPDHAASTAVRPRVRQHGGDASRRTTSGSGGVPPCPGGQGAVRWVRRLASQASTVAGSDERGQDANGTRPPGRREHPADGLVPSRSRRMEHHGHLDDAVTVSPPGERPARPRNFE